jgi:hypothetical protein
VLEGGPNVDIRSSTLGTYNSLGRLGSGDSLCVSLVYHVRTRDFLTLYIFFNKHSFFFKFFMFILL